MPACRDTAYFLFAATSAGWRRPRRMPCRGRRPGSRIHVAQQVVNAVGAGEAVGEAFEIINVHPLVLALWLPVFAVIFEIADEFFFLAIHRDDWVFGAFKACTGGFDVPALRLPVGMGPPFNIFLVGFERKAQAAKEVRERRFFDVMLLLCKRQREMGQRFGGPAHKAHRVAFVLDHGFELADQRRLRFGELFSAPSRFAQAVSAERLTRLNHTFSDRLSIRPGVPRDGAHAPQSDLFRLGSQAYPPRELIELWAKHGILLLGGHGCSIP